MITVSTRGDRVILLRETTQPGMTLTVTEAQKVLAALPAAIQAAKDYTTDNGLTARIASLEADLEKLRKERDELRNRQAQESRETAKAKAMS